MKTFKFKPFSLIIPVLFLSLHLSAQEDDRAKYGATESEQIACMEALSVYKSFKSQDNQADAYPAWQKACQLCPPDASEGLYIDGAKFIKEELKSTKDKERKKALVDSLMANYDQRMEHFASTDRQPNNRCVILGYKASDFSRIYKSKTLESYQMFKESVDCLGAESSAGIISGYYMSLFYAYRDAEADQRPAFLTDLLTEYLVLQDYIDLGIKGSSNERAIDGYEKARNNLDEIFVQIAECDQMLPVLQQKVADNPDDLELKKKALRLLNKKDCSDSDFFIEIAKAVYDAEPDPNSAFSIGLSLAKKGDYTESLKYLEEAAEGCTDCPDRETYLLKAGQVAAVVKQFSKARNYARQVQAINSKNGQAIILEGDAIMGMSGSCDDGALGARSVYWLATDYFNRAKSVDSSVADAANRRIATAKGQYPSKEDIFSVTKKEGDSFTVPCLGESTTIRAR